MSSQLEISGLKKLRIYALIALISILISLSLNIFLQITPLTIQQQPGAPPTAPLRELARLFGLIIPFLIVGAILQLASLIILRSGFKDLLQVRRDVGVGVTGTTLYIVSLPILVIGAVGILFFVIRSLPAFQNPPVSPTLVGPLVGGVILLLIGALIALVGAIMVIIGLFKVGSIYGDGLIKVGAILTIIPYLNLVAPFLLIFGSGNAIRKVQGGYPGQSPGPQTPPQFPGQSPGMGPQVYQVGVGSLDDNGVTRLTLYSASPMTLVSATLYTQSGPRVARSLTPSLSPGYNNVEITFDVSPLPKGTYNVDITFSNGLSLRVLVVH